MTNRISEMYETDYLENIYVCNTYIKEKILKVPPRH